MWRTLGKLFLSGLAALLPIIVTVALLWWLGSTAEAFLGRAIKLALPEHWYIPGMGLAAGIALVFAVGVLLHAWIFRQVFGWGERLFNRIPLVKTVYGTVRDLINLAASDRHARFSKVVTVTLPGTQMKLIGFVTRESFYDLPAGLADEQTIAVYFPMSYQIGGYTFMLPRSQVQPLNMSLEDAMRYTLTAGMSVKQEKQNNRGPEE